MSDNDAFDRAVRALRETGETSAADVARTRMRMLETLRRGERRGRRTFWVLLPIAAVLAGGAAFAKDSDVVRRVWTGVAETVGLLAPPENPPIVARSANGQDTRAAPGAADEANGSASELAALAPAQSAPPVEVAPPSPVPAATPDAPSVAPRRDRRAQRAEHAAPATKPTPPPETVETEAPSASASDGEAASLHLYKHAYRLHFVEQRYAAAITAWDEYLRAAPAGRLVVEARYNRGIALARLGRRAEAESALAPFARGEVSGGYRAREARELLEVLNGSSR
jgi:tetratricopeptide (TPR) repeat protein